MGNGGARARNGGGIPREVLNKGILGPWGTERTFRKTSWPFSQGTYRAWKIKTITSITGISYLPNKYEEYPQNRPRK